MSKVSIAACMSIPKPGVFWGGENSANFKDEYLQLIHKYTVKYCNNRVGDCKLTLYYHSKFVLIQAQAFSWDSDQVVHTLDGQGKGV